MKRRPLILTLLCAVWTTLCFVLPDFCDNPVEGFRGVATIAVYLTALGVLQFLIIYPFSLNKVVFAVFLPLYALVGSAVGFYRVAFHSTPTPMLVESVLNTNAAEAAGVVTWQAVLYAALNIAIAILFVRERWHTPDYSKRWLHLLIAVIALLLYYNFNGRLSFSLRQRYPMNVLHACKEYIHTNRMQRNTILQDPVITSAQTPDSLTVVLVLGEAMRADHLQLNGYPRATTPRLMQRRNIVSLPHVYSQHTHTAASLPHILTPADSLHPEYASSYHSCVSCFSRCGFTTAWISNQDMGRTYANFIHEADSYHFPNADKSVFVFSGWYDEQLLTVFDSLRLSEDIIKAGKEFYVLHCIGSHWYYNIHVPEQYWHFQPVTDNRVVTDNTDEQIVNSYDNTALYVDVVLDALISRLEDSNAIVIYLSDHGESLGERGNYLHAAGAEETKYPAAIVWYSDRYALTFPEKVTALQQNAAQRYQTDFLFYSILSAACIEAGIESGIAAEGNTSALDIFR